MLLEQHYEIHEYVQPTGRNPFREWLETLGQLVWQKVQARVFRMERGNLGDFKFLGDGVYETRLHFGAGYRIYFGFTGRQKILLLLGGQKNSQQRDIKKANQYLQDFLQE